MVCCGEILRHQENEACFGKKRRRSWSARKNEAKRAEKLNLGAVGLCPRESNRERRRLSPLAICSQPSELEHTTKGEEDYERASARARGARPSRRKTPRNQGERSLPPLPEGSALGGTGPEGPPIWAPARNKAGRTVHCANLAPLPSRTLAARSFFFSFLLTKPSPSHLPPPASSQTDADGRRRRSVCPRL